MKRPFLILQIFILIFCLTACGSGTPPESTSPDIDVTPSSSPDASIEPSVAPEPSILPKDSITIEVKNKSGSASIGNVPVLTYNFDYPVIKITGEQTEAYSPLTSWATKLYDDSMTWANDLEAEARVFYEVAGDQFSPYFFKQTIEKVYESETATVVTVYFSSFLGGVHPSHATTATCIDMTTGMIVQLEDISDIDPLTTVLEQNILAQIDAQNIGDLLFEDYADYIYDGVQDGFWYITENGLSIIYNEYQIGPYASGSFTFTVPFDEIKDYIDDEWILK